MKKIILMIWSAICLLSCIKDDGNYTYTPIQPIAITGVNTSYRVLLQATLNIPITLKTDINEADLRYTWMMEGDTLSRVKDLNYTFTKQSAAEHVLVFEIRNMSNNVRYTKTAKLSIVSPFQTGWAFLTEKNSLATLSFLSYESSGTLYKDVYQTVNGEPLGTGAVSVKTLFDFDVNRISILCSTGKSVELDGTSFLRKKYYKDEFKATGFEPLAINTERFFEDRFFFIISGGKIYSKNTGFDSVDDAFYQFPLDGDAKGYLVAPNYTKGSLNDFYLVYDNLNKRYLRFVKKNFSSVPSPLNLVSTSAPAFDPNNVEGESVWMGQSSAKKALSIIKTPAGKYVLHLLNSQLLSAQDRWIAEASYQFADGIINSSSCFATQATIPYLMIGTGKSLKALNLDALSSGAAAINNIATYDADITSMSYGYNVSKSVNELGLALNTGDPEFPGSFILINPALNANGAIIRRVDKIGGVVKSMVRKIQ